MNILKRLFTKKKPKETSIDIEKKVRIHFTRLDDNRLRVSIYKIVRDVEVIHDVFYIHRGDDMHITWELDISNEEIKKAFKLLVG